LNTVVVDLGWGRLHFRLWGLWDLLAEVWLVGSLVVVVVSVKSQEELALLDVLQLISVVVLTSVNTLWVFALTAELVRADLVNGSNGTSVLTWVSIQTDKVLSAVFWVSVTGEGAWVGVILLVGAHESSVVFINFAVWNLISPHTNTSFSIISQSRSTSVLGSFSIPTTPESITPGLIREDTIKTGAVRSRLWRLQFSTIPTINIVKVVAVLSQEFGVTGLKSESITTGLELSLVVLTLPEFVTGASMWVESIFMWAFETLLSKHCMCNEDNSNKCLVHFVQIFFGERTQL